MSAAHAYCHSVRKPSRWDRSTLIAAPVCFAVMVAMFTMGLFFEDFRATSLSSLKILAVTGSASAVMITLSVWWSCRRHEEKLLRQWYGSWTLQDMYDEYGREVLDAAAHDAGLDGMIEAWCDVLLDNIEETLETHPPSRPSRRRSTARLLRACAAHLISAATEPSAVIISTSTGFSHTRVGLAAVCRIAQRHGLIRVQAVLITAH